MGLQVFTNSMPSGQSLVTFDVGGAFTRMFVQVPSFTSQTALGIEVATASNATYYQFAQEVPQTTTVQVWPYLIAATATSGGFLVPLPVSNFQYFRFRAKDSSPTAAVDFKVICSNSF